MIILEIPRISCLHGLSHSSPIGKDKFVIFKDKQNNKTKILSAMPAFYSVLSKICCNYSRLLINKLKGTKRF